MKIYIIFFSGIILLMQLGCMRRNEKKWFLKATYNEGCSCNAPCPCPFGLPMTNSYCKLNGLVEIHEGEYNKIDLSGIKVILSGKVGSWGEYYFSETTSNEQKEALEDLLQIINVTGFDTIIKSEKTKIEYKKDGGNIFYSTSLINVQLDMVEGADEKPVKIENLRSKLFKDYIPHLAIVNERLCSDTSQNFSFPQKSGFTSYWNLTDKDFE